MKQKYETPTLEEVMILSGDVLTTSPLNPGDEIVGGEEVDW